MKPCPLFNLPPACNTYDEKLTVSQVVTSFLLGMSHEQEASTKASTADGRRAARQQ
jgi:hypothetical protein